MDWMMGAVCVSRLHRSRRWHVAGHKPVVSRRLSYSCSENVLHSALGSLESLHRPAMADPHLALASALFTALISPFGMGFCTSQSGYSRKLMVFAGLLQADGNSTGFAGEYPPGYCYKEQPNWR